MAPSAATPEPEPGWWAREARWLAGSWHECASPSQPASQPARESRELHLRDQGDLDHSLSLSAAESLYRASAARSSSRTLSGGFSCAYCTTVLLHLRLNIANSLPLRPYRKILQSVCAISNGAWRSHFVQTLRSLSSLTLPSLPRITLGISSGITWVSCSCSLRHCSTLHTICQTMLPVLSHP